MLYDHQFPGPPPKGPSDFIRQKKSFLANFVLYFGIIDFFPDYGCAILPLGFLFLDIWLLCVLFVIKFFDSLHMWRKFVCKTKDPFLKQSPPHLRTDTK